MNETMEDARATEKSIKFSDINEWFDNNIKSTTHVEGTDSFVAHGPYLEYQLDLICIKHLPDLNYAMAKLCIDTSTKYRAIMTLKPNNEREFALVSFNGCKSWGDRLKSFIQMETMALEIKDYFRHMSTIIT